MEIFFNILILIAGIILLIKGADFFVEGSSYVAKKLHIPSLVIGLTLVSIGTSLPEASVSITSAIKGMSDMSVGNVVGSNIFNCFVVIGLCAAIIPMVVSKDILKIDMPIYLGIIGILVIFAYLITPFVLDRWECGILFALFIAYIIFIIIRAKKNTDETIKEEDNNKKEKPTWLNIILIIVGLAGVVGGGTLTVNSASDLAKAFGMTENIVALTIVAIGTSLPELVTSLVASKKGENDIAVGNAIGSCIFNIIFILGMSGIINPLTLQPTSYIDMIFMTLALVVTFFFAIEKTKMIKNDNKTKLSFSISTKDAKIGRLAGIIMVLIYALYMTFLILRELQIIA